MSSESAFARFTFYWKIEWPQFCALSTTNITKFFITSFNNVALRWRIELSTTKESTRKTQFGLFLYYEDGPAAELKRVHLSVELFNSDKVIEKYYSGFGIILVPKSNLYDFDRGSEGMGLANFDDRNVATFQNQYCLVDSKFFYYKITLKIPISFFSPLAKDCVMPKESTQWLRSLFQHLEDPEKAKFSNAKLISKEGQIFYCHRLVLETQSDVLDAMFRHPTSDGVKEGEYEFSALSTNGLRALLDFFYTGGATLVNLATTEILEVADASEQYGLKILKQICAVALWKRVAEKPEDCFDVVRFSDLHQDWKYLKDQAMDVLIENFENLSLHTVDLTGRFGGGEIGERLRSEFALYGCRRLEPDIVDGS